MAYADVNNTRLYYEAAGEGAPVVFVHGGFPSLAMQLEDSGTWQWTWERDFASRFYFVWYDRRGCWRSASPRDGYALENQARDLASLLDHLHLDSVHLIGSSAGGPIAIVFAAYWPQRVRSLILAGTGLNLWSEKEDVATRIVRQQVAVLRRAGAQAAFAQRPAGVETSLEILWRPEEEDARGRLDEYMERERRRTQLAEQLPLRDRVHYYAVELESASAYMEHDVRLDAAKIAAPALVLHGSDDRAVPVRFGREIADTIPGATLHVVEGGGHSLVHRTREGREIVMDWLRKQESARASP
jgi:pimeloyl-ACP methyl ester carboxylesterase